MGLSSTQKKDLERQHVAKPDDLTAGYQLLNSQYCKQKHGSYYFTYCHRALSHCMSNIQPLLVLIHCCIEPSVSLSSSVSHTYRLLLQSENNKTD